MSDATPEPTSKQSEPSKAPQPASTVPKTKALGSVRDYFWEQMNQDESWNSYRPER